MTAWTDTVWTYEVGGWTSPRQTNQPDLLLADAFRHVVARQITLVAADGRRIDVTRAEYLDDSWRLKL